jgi:SAM-dependent methyltransferase
MTADERRPDADFELACPICRTAVEVEASSGLCKNEHRFRCADGIWRFLPLAREVQFREFLRDYQIVRMAEGWGSANAAYYRALPQVAASDPQCDIWRIRARNFRRLLHLIGDATELRILDAGAGNGWLAYQLARRGHLVAALDLSDDARDGLGARVHYDAQFACYQAEFDRLPFCNAQFDLVIFNGVLHYAQSLELTLCEAKRVLRADGRIVVLDSPFYSHQAYGAAMIAEREAAFTRKFGFRREVQAVSFLTKSQLQCAADASGLALDVQDGAADWDRNLRRAWTQWRTGRELARFPLCVLRRA